ncbi:hypothetical protein [Microbacterium esteraromaticum]|uniref:hypothetical protein n=1 Tax=Microbacterium esteraromaticum TaxID=57043 RepID=UPI001C938878|nr:hypothetical protein [Microbacterium esteraromaticum]MBY6061158.1 hypothetical protein [Microbacterium esteraromaticum]
MHSTDDTTALVPGTHRWVRRLDSPDTAVAGALVADGDALRVQVDADLVADVVWLSAGAQHVAGVVDVVRRRDGHDALLPWCIETVDALLARRAVAERGLTPGETVTLVGSLLRGVVEAERLGEPFVGRWWLTQDARPVFSPGEGATCAAASGELIARVRDACTDRAVERTLTEILSGIEDPRIVARNLDRWEGELVELAAPRPLQLEVHPPERASEIPVHRAHLPEDAGHVLAQRTAGTFMQQRWEQLLEQLRATRARLRPPSPRQAGGGRRRMLLIGAAAGAVVLLGGLLWPTGGDDTAATETGPSIAQTPADGGADNEHGTVGEQTPEPASTADASVDDEDAASDQQSAGEGAVADEPVDAGGADSDTGAGEDDSLEQIAARLLRDVADCAVDQDAVCERAIVGGAAELVQLRLSPVDPDRAIVPVEDYGDIGVVRLAASGEHGEQMLVVIRQNDRWLVRDVYDVADQPSEAG